MKKSGLFAASLAAASAASATAVSTSSNLLCNSNFNVSPEDASSKQDQENSRMQKLSSSSAAEKFAPRFDGLRFIETLITAHR